MAYGTVNADVIGTSVAGSNLGAGNASIMKNRIINGAMVIAQYGTGSTTPTASGYYSCDRWKTSMSVASKFSIQQNAGGLTPAVTTGFTNYLGATSASAYAVGAAETFNINQIIEGYNIADLAWGTANAKTVTLSFWAYSSLTGTFGGSLKNGTSARSYPFSYSIPVANTWTQISVTVAGDTSGTWATDNTGGMIVTFSLGSGSTFSGTAGAWATANYTSATGATSVVGTNGATFYITGVQLEVGSAATGFEYRQITTETALCQRYYAKMQPISGGYTGFGCGRVTSSATGADIVIKYPTTMRSSPSIVAFNTAIDASSFVATTTINAAYPGTDSGMFSFTAVGLTLGQGANLLANATTNAYISLSAEL